MSYSLLRIVAFQLLVQGITFRLDHFCFNLSSKADIVFISPLKSLASFLFVIAAVCQEEEEIETYVT